MLTSLSLVARKVSLPLLPYCHRLSLTISSSKTFLARLCEQAERYDEMVNYMKEVANVRSGCIIDIHPRIH